MTVLVLLETILLAVLTVLVAGLLRAYGAVLRRLHALDGGEDAGRFRLDSAPVGAPAARQDWTAAHDLSGETVAGELVTTRVVGVEHDSVLLFLSSGCASCETFWDELARPAPLPGGTRLVVITQGTEHESRAAVAELAPPGVEVLMSDSAWRDYEVPGSPHVVFVEGPTGRVRGEGTGQSWQQVARLVADAGRDRAGKPARDAEVEADVDRELMAAGILPGDPRLYGEQE